MMPHVRTESKRCTLNLKIMSATLTGPIVFENVRPPRVRSIASYWMHRCTSHPNKSSQGVSSLLTPPALRNPFRRYRIVSSRARTIGNQVSVSKPTTTHSHRTTQREQTANQSLFFGTDQCEVRRCFVTPSES